jgi:SAM-dependent methyltransferase
MLIPEAPQTHKTFSQETFDLIHGKIPDPYKDYTPEAKEVVDPYVQQNIAQTNSQLYRHLPGRLERYPIPKLPYPLTNYREGTLLDIGCNWGRWCIASAKLGYMPVGIDPSLEAILAAKRVTKQLDVRAKYLVADSRFLPFKQSIFDYVYSYSVFQHFDRQDVRTSLPQIARVLRPDGISMIQMLNKFGLRSLYSQLRRGFREARDFEPRYWSPTEVVATFNEGLGPTKLLVGSFFTQGQATDKDLFRPRDKVVFEIAEALKYTSYRLRFLTKLADNLFLYSKAAKLGR